MLSRKRPVVQLTSLLDLLFIMIFISLAAPVDDGTDSEETRQVVEPIDTSTETLVERLEQTRKKNQLLKALADTPEKATSEQAQIGEFRKLFIANIHYLRSGYRYTETIIYSADDQSGLYEYRVNLQGAGILTTNGGPLTEAEIDQIKVCDSVTVTREKISQDCRLIYDRHLIIDCNRADARNYHCLSKLVRRLPNGQLKTNRYEYKMELVKIYDPSLV
jgi:hypothetical protein